MSLLELKQRLQPDPREFTARLLRDPEVKSALDIGCGTSSYLSPHRPRLRTVGLDAFAGAIEKSRRLNVHDDYILADILATPAEAILERVGGERFDLVALFDVIEHLPKKLGWELLEKCERLTSRYVLLQTPNGFMEQGPEFGNVYQRHLSGWFPHDFAGLGYQVAGCAGTRFFHGYAGEFKWNFPGVKLADFALGLALDLEKRPRHAFNIMAWKDVRGVAARLKA
jgi:SAM-dependent methyltransferase